MLALEKTARPRAHPPLPVLHRLAIAYLTLPLLIWTACWFQWWLGVPLCILTALAIAPLLTGPWRLRRLSPATQVVLVIAAAGVALSPAGGFFGWAITDWDTQRGLFADLTNRPWPVRLAIYSDEPPPLLTYYTAWYLVPALFGKWFGPAALNWAVPAWAWCGVALVLLLFTRRLPTFRAVAAALAFLLFSGLDALEILLHEGLFDGLVLLATSFGGSSLEWWYQWGPTRLAFLSHMEMLLWSTQHFITAGLSTLLLVQLQRNRRFLAGLGVLLACLLMWSPLVAVTLAVLTGGLLVGRCVRAGCGRSLRAGRAGPIGQVFSWRNLAVAPLLVGVIGLYLFSGPAERLPFGGIWDQFSSIAQMVASLSIAYLAEFALLALLLALAKPRIVRHPLFITAAAIALVALPIYYGSSRINDFAMRVGAPVTVLLAYWAIREVVRLLPREARGPWRPWGKGVPRRTLAAGMLAAALLVATAGSLSELASQVRAARWLPYESGGWSLAIDRGDYVWHRYLAFGEIPKLLDLLLRDAEDVSFDRGERLIDSHYDVYRKGERLIYATDSCRQSEDYGLFAHVYPADPGRLAATGPDFETLRLDIRPERVWKGNGHCVAAFRLPRYDIACIHAGQRDPAKQLVIWEGWHPSPRHCANAVD